MLIISVCYIKSCSCYQPGAPRFNFLTPKKGCKLVFLIDDIIFNKIVMNVVIEFFYNTDYLLFLDVF